MFHRLIASIRAKLPKMALRAQTKPLPAIRLFCLECMGGQGSEVRSCDTTECPLHPFRLGSRPKRDKGATKAPPPAFLARRGLPVLPAAEAVVEPTEAQPAVEAPRARRVRRVVVE